MRGTATNSSWSNLKQQYYTNVLCPVDHWLEKNHQLQGHDWEPSMFAQFTSNQTWKHNNRVEATLITTYSHAWPCDYTGHFRKLSFIKQTHQRPWVDHMISNRSQSPALNKTWHYDWTLPRKGRGCLVIWWKPCLVQASPGWNRWRLRLSYAIQLYWSRKYDFYVTPRMSDKIKRPMNVLGLIDELCRQTDRQWD